MFKLLAEGIYICGGGRVLVKRPSEILFGTHDVYNITLLVKMTC